MKFNDSGLALLKEFEGCSLVSYQDQKGIWTIGYGCTHHVTPNMTITADEASDRLKMDIEDTCKVVSDLIKPSSLNDNQFSAVVCLSYNIGVGNLRLSTLLNSIRLHKLEDAANEFERWCKVNGTPCDGLLRRRKTEKELFLAPV